jgi:hypothetical protein
MSGPEMSGSVHGSFHDVTAQSLVDSFEHRDALIDAGLPEGYARLDQLLAEM